MFHRCLMGQSISSATYMERSKHFSPCYVISVSPVAFSLVRRVGVKPAVVHNVGRTCRFPPGGSPNAELPKTALPRQGAIRGAAAYRWVGPIQNYTKQSALDNVSCCTDHRHDARPQGFGQVWPASNQVCKIKVDRTQLCANCAGFCAA